MNRQQQQLVEDNMRLVYHIVHRYFPTYSNDEDMMQIAMLGLCYAAETWDESKGSFNTYGGRCVRNQILNELKYRRCQCRQGGSVSLDIQLGDDLCLGDTIVGETDVGFIDIQEFYDTLTPKEQKFFDLIYKGTPKGDIAKQFGVSRQTISSYNRLLKKRMEEFYGT